MKLIQGKKYLWHVPPQQDKSVLDIAVEHNLSLPIAQTIASRGYTTQDDITSFLFTPKSVVAHPCLLKDSQKAVDRIIAAINNKEKMLIAGDYDVDGITSASLMILALRPLNAHINFFLPHRVKDGYGLSSKVVERAAANNYSLIITVDNGITAFEPAKCAKELGIDLIITDHHRPHDDVPDAFAIINPNQNDCPYPFKELAGVGVIFKLLTLLYEQLGYKELPAKVYELLLLGTIADVVPLLGENRYWVRHGLEYINSFESTSLKVLRSNTKLQKPTLSSTDIGFCITPQINALGRLEDPRQGVQFLVGSNEDEVRQVGAYLRELNEARKSIERSIVNEIINQIENKHIDLDQENIIMAASAEWPPGVIGLVASRMVSAYGKPTLLFHITSKGIVKGSCRSIPEFNMFDALHSARELLINFGGHSLAAGLSLYQKDLPKLKNHLEELISQQLSPYDLQQKMVLDASVKLPEINQKLLHDMQYLEPFGNKNPEPIFYLNNVSLVQPPILLKDQHVKAKIFADGVIKPVIFFNRPDLFEFFMNCGTDSFDLAVTVSENHWNNTVSIELIGVDVSTGKENNDYND